ncbi:MAG: LCP family protein [Lachnospiraceae bacterium]|nr:LCP family protein [Lachnospiraceae bacterium]
MAKHTRYDDEEVVTRPRSSSSGKTSSGKSTRSKSKKKKKKKNSRTAKVALLIAEIALLFALLFVFYVIHTGTKVGKVSLNDEEIVAKMNTNVVENEEMKGYRNIALFGVDTRSKNNLTSNTRSDAIMVLSINQDTGDMKIVSVYRDTYLNLSNDSYNKCNAAYAKGGPEQAINMLNMNLDLNITDFVTIGFQGLIDVVDALGGVEIDIQENEISYLNDYQRSMFVSESGVGALNENIVKVTHSGLQTLNGLQATAYCRIRYVGNDFGRTERQRTVLNQIFEKSKTMSVSQLNEIANELFDEVYTSLDLSEILEMIGEVNKYQITAMDGFPQMNLLTTGTVGSKGSCVIPRDLSDNVVWLHQFLFEDSNYTVSAEVQEYSNRVASDTAGISK